VLTVVFNAAPLITACTFAVQGGFVIDHLLPECCIVIAPSVEEEVAILGASYPDGVVAGERIARGGIQVTAVAERKWTRYLRRLCVGRRREGIDRVMRATTRCRGLGDG
jgi:hypothetical protein